VGKATAIRRRPPPVPTDQHYAACLDLLPKGKFNDGLILTETALAAIPLLVKSNADLLDIEQIALCLQF
jgi:hypothetical protein